MAGITVSYEVLNQLNTPTLYADTLALRPSPAIVGRIFFRTDAPYAIYRDTGTVWDLIASPDTTGITGSLAAGQVPYATGATTLAGTNNLFFDSTNNRLGINTASPGAPLDVHGTGTQMQLNGTSTNNSFLVFQNAGTSKWRLGNNYSGATNYFSIFDNTNSGEIVKIESGTTALNGILTNSASVRNNYTEIGIAAATSVNGFATSNSYTFNAGITRTIGTIGNALNSTFTYSGTFTQDVTGDWTNFNAGFTLVMNGNITNNQPAPYIKSASAGRFNLTPSGTGTISHFATLVTAPDFGGTTLTVTNRYGVLINNFAGFTSNPVYTNRWGIYQDGSSDNNYFAGKLLLGTTTVGTTLLNVNGTSLFQNSVGIGSAVILGRRVSNRLSLTGATTAIGYEYEGNVLSDVTSDARGFSTYIDTSGTFTLNQLKHFSAAANSTFSATVTHQYAFFVDSTLTGATNNYGFFGAIASGTNRWNLYMSGTANNYMAGSLGIGSTSLATQNFRIGKQITGATTYYNFRNDSQIQTDVTGTTIYNYTSSSTAVSTTINTILLNDTNQGTFGAGSTVTTQIGFRASSTLIGATNNYGFFGSIPSGTGRWNIYLDGTAQNYFEGSLSIGVTTANASAKLQIDTTTQGFLPPRMTTTQKNAIGTPAAGLVIFDTTLAKLCVYSGSAWQTITSV